MQYPNSSPDSRQLTGDLILDCKNGALKHTVLVEIRHRPAPKSADSSTASLMRAAFIETSYEATIYRITAPDLENWMLKQGETPSEHLSWWFQSASTVHDDTATPVPVVDVVPARPDPERRLALLRELGGAAKYTRGEWTFTGINALAGSEKANGRKRSSEKTIRTDLKEAARNERDESRAGFHDGLGQR